jgi:hypothetical protein
MQGRESITVLLMFPALASLKSVFEALERVSSHFGSGSIINAIRDPPIENTPDDQRYSNLIDEVGTAHATMGRRRRSVLRRRPELCHLHLERPECAFLVTW